MIKGCHDTTLKTAVAGQRAADPTAQEAPDRGRAARLQIELSGLGGREDGPSARGRRGGAGARGQ